MRGSDWRTIEASLKGGDAVPWARIQTYLKVGSALYSSNHTDLLGGDYGADQIVDVVPAVPASTYAALSDVAPFEFWSPFRVP